jgi:hypothetical protein
MWCTYAITRPQASFTDVVDASMLSTKKLSMKIDALLATSAYAWNLSTASECRAIENRNVNAAIKILELRSTELESQER